MAGKDKTRKADPVDPLKREAHKPSFAKDRVERGLEADDTRPLFAAEAIHPTQEAKFAFDSDGPVGGPVPDLRSPIDESDEELRQRRGAPAKEDSD